MHRWLVAVTLAVVSLLGLATASKSVGFARDEGIYFQASRAYGTWASQLADDPRAAMQPEARDRAFGVNREHPPAMKLLAGISGRLLSDPDAIDASLATEGEREVKTRPRIRESQAMRLPAQVLAALGVFLLVMVAGKRRLETGVLAGLGFIALPRVFFHAQLHAFDIPIAIASLVVVLVYRRALTDWRFGLALGPVLGLAIVVKHNALFIPIVLVVHYLACRARLAKAPSSSGAGNRAHQGRLREIIAALGRLAPLPFWSMLVLAPLTAWALWPWMWHDSAARFAEYLAFHREHSYYNMAFLGHNYNQPPMPFAYPWVMLAATVPLCLLLLSALGLGWSAVQDWRTSGQAEPSAPGTFFVPMASPHTRLDGLLLLLMSAYPIALIALPSIPIFGGTKHFLTALPFMLWGAARGFDALVDRLPAPLARRSPLLVVLFLIPGLWATIAGHPHNLSQYAGWIGGSRGAATLGLNRGYWGYDAAGVLALGAEAEAEADDPLAQSRKVWLHDMHPLAMEQYRRDGTWPPQWRTANLSQASAGLLFHEMHMGSDELRAWRALNTTAPSVVVTLHDVALTSLYLSP